MKKSQLEKKINELSQYLSSSTATKAINSLLGELSSYSEPSSSKSSIGSNFKLPGEVSSDKDALALYTDGACRGNPGPGSYAYMIQNPTGDIVHEAAKSEKLTTNNKMELQAIIKGLVYLSKNSAKQTKIYVYTDSKYVVNGMNSWVANWKKRGWKKADNKAPENIELWKELDQLSTICTLVSFNWIKGHAGHPQNEYVDNLANIVLDENGY